MRPYQLFTAIFTAILLVGPAYAQLTPPRYANPGEVWVPGTWGTPGPCPEGRQDYGISYSTYGVSQPRPYRSCEWVGGISAPLICPAGMGVYPGYAYDYIGGGYRNDACQTFTNACTWPWALAYSPSDAVTYGIPPTRSYGSGYVCIASAANACAQIPHAYWVSASSSCLCQTGFVEYNNTCAAQDGVCKLK